MPETINPALPPKYIDLSEYRVVSPGGESVVISKELFFALRDYLGTGKPNGRVEIDMRNGNIAGVRGMRVYK